jgi:hypothetical protein
MIATVYIDFEPSGPGQLQFSKGDQLIVIDFAYSDGWAHVASLDGKRVGIFPQAFIKRV